jgi:hypothetical protein
MLNPNRITRVLGKKVLLQEPYSNNCAVIAILNACMQDNEISDKELEYLENKYNKKYELHKQGLQITIAGAIAWDLGYNSYISVTAGPQGFSDAYNSYRIHNDKIIRIFSWIQNDTQYSLEDREKYKEYAKHFIKDTPPVAVNAQHVGAHATLAINIQSNGDCLFLNYLNGVNTEHNWFKMGHPKWQETPTCFSGGDIILIMGKK